MNGKPVEGNVCMVGGPKLQLTEAFMLIESPCRLFPHLKCSGGCAGDITMRTRDRKFSRKDNISKLSE